MATHTNVLGMKVKRGKRMTEGAGWRLVIQKGSERAFVGTLLKTFNLTKKRRIAIFSAPKD
ncbi:MAG: hypothetical protein WCA98_06770 [Candidatus Acidiferrales bacterium]